MDLVVQQDGQQDDADADDQAQHAAQHGITAHVGGDRCRIDSGAGDDLDGTGFDGLENDVRGDDGDLLTDLARPLGVVALDRDLHDLGVIHGADRDTFSQLFIRQAQTQVVNDLLQHGIALDDDAVGGDQLGGGVDLVAGDVGGRILTGVDDHQGGSLVLRGDKELGDAESDTGQNYGGENNGQQVLPECRRSGGGSPL